MSDAREKESRFCETARQMGLVTPEQVQECLEVQRRMAEMGVHDTIGAIMVKKGVINQGQVNQVMKALGVEVQPIPGYQVLSRLGQGGMGVVYKAKQVSMDRVVALKVLSPEATKSPNFIERFFREAQAAAKLNHRNIIQAYDVGSSGGVYYFAMEFVDGQTCRELVRKNGRFSEKRALDIAMQVAEALGYIGRHGMIHRDVKPENIMVAADGTAKLCDFGLARSVTSDHSVTRAGFTFGTPYYMSPEQISGEKNLDVRTDIYSLGASLFYLLTGRQVFEGSDLRQVLTRHLTEAPPSPKSLVPALSDACGQVVLKMLAKDPRHRYGTPLELIEDIRAALGGEAPRHARAAARPGRGAWLAAAAAGGVLAVVGVLALALSGGKPAADSTTRNSNPATLPTTRKDAPRTIPAVTDEREIRAEGAFHRAVHSFGQSEWDDAIRSFRQLEDEFASTQFFAAHKQEIWERRREAESKLAAVLAERERKRMQEEADLRREFREADALFMQRLWAQARDAYQKLLGRDLPPGIDAADLRRSIHACEQELVAAEFWTKLRQMERDGLWEELGRGLTLFQERYGNTAMFNESAVEQAALAERARRELACRGSIQDALARFEAGKFEEAAHAIAAINVNFRDTRTLQQKKEELEDKYGLAVAKVREPLEAKARERLAEADAAFAARDWPKADALYAELEAEPLVSTQAGGEARPHVAARRTEVARLRREALEEEAAAAFKAAELHVRKQNWEAANEEIDRLNEKLKDTEFFKKRERQIVKMGGQIQAELQKLSETRIDDFDGDAKKWTPYGDGEKGRIEIVKEPIKYGDGAARITFVEHKGTFAGVEFKLDKPVPDKATGVSFWVKGDSKAALVRFLIKQGKDEGEAIYGVLFQVDTTWQLVRLPFSEFKHQWSRADDNKKPPPRFDPSKAVSVMFSQGSPKNVGSYVVDLLKFEVRK